MEQDSEEHTLCLFGDCKVPAFRVSRPAQSVLAPDQWPDRATPSPPSPQELAPPPVLIYHSDGSEESLNPHVAARLSTLLRPETPLWCNLVDPDSLNPPELIELVEFRFRLLDPIYHPCPGHSDADAYKAAIQALADSGSLRELVLRYFFPQKKACSGQVLADLFLNRVSKRMALNYANQVASPPPWDNATPQSPPTPTPQQKARQYWEAYRTQEHPTLPPFEEAVRTFRNHTPDAPHPGEEDQVFSRILLNRLDPIQGETDAFPVIATFLDEAGHLLDKKTGGPSSQGMASAQELPTAETEPGSPAYDPNEAYPEEPPLPNTDGPGYGPPRTGEALEPDRETESKEDPLLPRIREIIEAESGALARSDDCWAQLLEQARAVHTEKGTSFYEGLQNRLAKPHGGKPRDILIRFLDKLSERIDLPC